MIAKNRINIPEAPDAVVCANDAMAVGVVEYFKMIGISVPKDVLLTGFDNSEIAKYSSPSITSIDKNPHELGYQAIQEVLGVLDGKEPRQVKIETQPVGRESCGCGTADDIDINRLKYKYMQKDIYSHHLSQMINANLTQFSGLQTPEEVLPIIKESIPRISLKAFYLCFQNF